MILSELSGLKTFPTATCVMLVMYSRSMTTTAIERHEIGSYLVVGRPGNYRVMENFGSYRMLKKVFETLESAMKRARAMK